MRNVYLGTSEFAAAVLERLAASPFPPELVITRPDSARGRGRRLAPPPVAGKARELGLELLQPASPQEPAALERIAAARPDALCVCAYGLLIREPLLSSYEPLNVHPSLLPRWRGAAPIERAMMAGDARTGVSIMRLVEQLDAGPVCLQADEEIRADDDAASLGGRLQELAGELLVQALEQRPPCWEQPADGVTYAEKLGAADRALDPANPAAVEERRVRALRPHVGARLALPDGTLLGVRAARVGEPARAPGRLRVDDGSLLLDCRDAALELLEVLPPGGRAMPAADWLRGRPPAALTEGPVPSPSRPGA